MGHDTEGAFYLFRQHRFRCGSPPSQDALMAYRAQALQLAGLALEALCLDVSRNPQQPAVHESLRGLVREYANGEANEKFSAGKLPPDVLYQVNTVWNSLKHGLQGPSSFDTNTPLRFGFYWMGAFSVKMLNLNFTCNVSEFGFCLMRIDFSGDEKILNFPVLLRV